MSVHAQVMQRRFMNKHFGVTRKLWELNWLRPPSIFLSGSQIPNPDRTPMCDPRGKVLAVPRGAIIARRARGILPDQLLVRL